MWDWFFGRKNPAGPSGGQPPPEESPGEPPADFPVSTTLGPLAQEMKARGYRGPYANVRDGILALLFHGPNVFLEPPWSEPTSNSFQMRVLDCKSYCMNSCLFALDEGSASIEAAFSQAREGLCKLAAIPDALEIPCLLSYPRSGDRPPDGALYLAECMEDPWNMFLFADHFYFTRSWTGELCYRARVQFREGALFVLEVEASPTRSQAHPWSDLEDERLPVRQVDFLIKTILYNLVSPAPLPGGLRDEPGAIALYSFTEYGRRGWFPSFDETTEYCLCLNGVLGRFPDRWEKNVLVPVIRAVEECDSAGNRQRLLEELEGCGLYFAFSVPEEELKLGPITPATPIEFHLCEWHGGPCIFAYTDPAFRVEPSQGCIEIEAARWWGLVKEKNERACLVINPGGPATCKLEPAELQMLAQ
jgi:hypothetical protein